MRLMAERCGLQEATGAARNAQRPLSRCRPTFAYRGAPGEGAPAEGHLTTYGNGDSKGYKCDDAIFIRGFQAAEALEGWVVAAVCLLAYPRPDSPQLRSMPPRSKEEPLGARPTQPPFWWHGACGRGGGRGRLGFYDDGFQDGRGAPTHHHARTHESSHETCAIRKRWAAASRGACSRKVGVATATTQEVPRPGHRQDTTGRHAWTPDIGWDRATAGAHRSVGQGHLLGHRRGQTGGRRSRRIRVRRKPPAHRKNALSFVRTSQARHEHGTRLPCWADLYKTRFR